MTGVIQQMLTVIEQAFGITLSSGSVSVGRFITHLRYLFVRIHQHKQLDSEPTSVGNAIRDAFPEASEVAVRLAWRGVPILNLPTAVRYPSKEEGGISQFRYFRDNTLLTWMYFRLLFGFVIRLPKLLTRGPNPLKSYSPLP